jgi:two-component system, cell cycle response regulator DivK
MPSDESGAGAPWKVLLVEDVEDAREMYASYLQFAGFDVTTASNGALALVEVERSRPDLILMDAAMPGVDGWEATRHLKSNPRTASIPVLILTAHVFEDARRRTREAGADGFIDKPCLPDELARRIRDVLEQAARVPRPPARSGRSRRPKRSS